MSLLQSKSAVMQRVQIGLIGLVVVLLFVSLANLVLDSAVENGSAGTGSVLGGSKESNAKSPGEPLAELGAAPVVEPDKAAENATNRNPLRNDAVAKDRRADRSMTNP